MNDTEDTIIEEPEAENDAAHLPVVEQLAVALGILVLVFGATYVPSIATTISKNATAAGEAFAARSLDENAESQSAVATNPFDGMTIEGQTAFIYDVRDQKVLFNKDADDAHVLASITKLMTALVAYELLGDKERINIDERALEEYGDSGFSDGETFTLDELLDLTLVTSSNDGAFALAETAGEEATNGQGGVSAFIDAMNIRATEIGLTQTYFNNPTGLDVSSEEGGAYGSARDVTFLMEYMIRNYPNLLELTKVDDTRVMNEAGEVHLAENTNTAVREIPGLIASKTGYTELAGGNLVVAFDAGLNHPVIITVLGSSREGRFTDVVKLVDATRAYMNN